MSNVVPFPRDWLGPRDELVPFGRDVLDKPEAEAGAADVHALAPPPGPEAFWGEDSAEIHAVLQGPDASTRDPEPESQPTPKPRHRPSRALAVIVAGLLAAFAAAAVTIIGLGSKSPPRAEMIPNPVLGSPHAEELRLASLRRALAASAASDTHKKRRGQKHVATTNQPRHRPSHRSAPKPARHVVVAHASSPTYPVTTQPVSSPTSTASAAQSSPPSSSARSQPVDVPSSSSTGSVVSEPSQPTSSNTASSGGATSSHSEGQSSKAKAPAGPTGNSALLGPGHCNC